VGIVGGRAATGLLTYLSPNGEGPFPQGLPAVYQGKSKLETLVGPAIWTEIQDRVVLDFGCGRGEACVEVAQRGARRVIGLDINEAGLEIARKNAQAAGVSDRCEFVRAWDDPVDLILSVDSFEHFADPAAILPVMRRLLKPNGSVVVSFGPTWLHPLGGHLYSIFPYAHLLFTERALVNWRSRFKTDGARSIAESGLNRMTIRRFERYVEESPFTFASFEPVPIRRLRRLNNGLTREFTTAVVRCRLVPK
jgi:ubiquinone/menaquinone biosynthesis C-methylase UbiE